jgi:hypothetical protein
MWYRDSMTTLATLVEPYAAAKSRHVAGALGACGDDFVFHIPACAGAEVHA